MIGLCELNEEGILKLHYNEQVKIPAIKRHAKNILKRQDSTMQYNNAKSISEELNIPLKEIIKLPSNKKGA